MNKLNYCFCSLFRLCSCSLTKNSCDSLASALKSRPFFLQELDLSQNQLQDIGIMLLSDGLKSPRCRLKTLRLRSCLLSDSGCIGLVSALESQLPHLMEVDLSGNELQERGKRVLLGLVKLPGCRIRSLRVGDGQDLVKRVRAGWLTFGAKLRKTSGTDETESLKLQGPSDISTTDRVKKGHMLPRTVTIRRGSGSDAKLRRKSEADKKTLMEADSYSYFPFMTFGTRALPRFPALLNTPTYPAIPDSLDLSLDPNRTKSQLDSTADQGHKINTHTLFSPELFNEREHTSYRFRSWSAGVFQCKLTRLVFKMTRAGELMYWIIQWDEDLLNSAGKTPAGPLFSISCSEGSVSQLHLPHCGNLPGLSVVHISNDGMSILQPLEITASHVVVDVPHLSAFGLVWDIIKRLLNIQIQICGQVLLFHRPPYKNQSQKLNVFLLPENVPLQEVKCQQKMAEYIEATSFCLLTTGQFYSLLCPEAHTIQPERALFDLKYGPNYHPTFDIRMTPNTKEVTVRVRDQEERHVWAYRAELPGQTIHTITSDSAYSLHGRVTDADVQAAPAFSLLSAQPPSTEPGSSSLVTSDRRGGRSSSAPGPSSQLIHTITSDSASSMHGLVTDGDVQAAPAFSLLSAQPPSTEPGSSSLVTSDRRGEQHC
ncbi:NACHT, LRR and PYD domains-containing protein 1-like [Mugil cephalus]|uniref:NACHT, LRR and PYD domains-containing protein 1-like n=1 Tax=Mugil cephalus TaxID=48193 RepID=UPI001FB6F67C|nr:NACHT, LRR and PYD domains-containing protein 1-like [Mugil cephalus]